ncbi:hypothetical protein FGO68_gene5412 [Halteria grandinella]|uniref:Uncharacterized protein n=1 Tax=Halteria grandinella TaxID=5974 RepID=A0A8J8SWK3_HALGN|nr:hypothetical protein FGO68_gene5412 [Halteria grandinella]
MGEGFSMSDGIAYLQFLSILLTSLPPTRRVSQKLSPQKLKLFALSTMVSVPFVFVLELSSSLQSAAHGLASYACFCCCIIILIFSISSFCIASIIWYQWRMAMLLTTTDTPSMSMRITPPMNAFLKATERPPRMARMPPVRKPETMALQGSSFWRRQIIRQSIELKTPPHMAKEPPRKGARLRTWRRPPRSLWPRGAFQMPLMKYQLEPAITPMEKPTPRSSKMRPGQGDL